MAARCDHGHVPFVRRQIDLAVGVNRRRPMSHVDRVLLIDFVAALRVNHGEDSHLAVEVDEPVVNQRRGNVRSSPRPFPDLKVLRPGDVAAALAAEGNHGAALRGGNDDRSVFDRR